MDEIDPFSTFTLAEVEGGVPMPDRSLEFLKREGQTPPPVTAPGRGRTARYDFAGVSWLVIIGILMRVMGAPLQAARVAAGLVPALISHYGSVPFGFADLQIEVERKVGHTLTIRGLDDQICQVRTLQEAWRLGLVDPETPLPGDYLIVIADDEFVGRSNWRGLQYALGGNRSSQIEPLFRYTHAGARMGVKVEFVENQAMEDYFLDRFEKAESLVVLNASKAIRRTVMTMLSARAR